MLTVNTVGLASFSNNITINNGQFYQAKRNTAGSIINVLGFESGTDDLIQVTSNSFKLRNTGTGDAANMMTVSQAGAAVFSSSVTTTFLRITDSAGEIGEINSTNANGGYITWRTSGTTIADLGTAQQIFGSGGNDTFGINGRGTRALVFGTNNTERLRITSGGTVQPGANGTQDLGSTSFAWANIYTNDLHLSNMGKEGGNDIDGTSGTWTIQEGAEDLYIINNRNNKKFKIKLEEII